MEIVRRNQETTLYRFPGTWMDEQRFSGLVNALLWGFLASNSKAIPRGPKFYTA
jgi:hypothetical protein